MPLPLQGLTALAFVFAVGGAAQWLAWRVRVPAILLLLGTGFVVGPFTGALDPDRLFGSVFRPMVSLAVGLILFEGGLTLRFDELRGSGAVVRNLVTVGAAVTWALATLLGVHVAGVGFDVALLVGAILVLTGPTVVIPLVRDVRPRPPLGPILRWEGILIDPIGALLALLVLQALTAREGASTGQILFDLGGTVVVGGGLGIAAGLGLARALQRFLVPDLLQVPVTLGTVAAAFAGSNALQAESGLLAVTVMGITMGNRRGLDVARILEWKEQLTTILLSVLFVCIAARLPLDQLTALGWRSVAYTVGLILLVRPLSVWAATAGSGMPWRERGFLMAMAPRGIVVAAVSSEFSLHYEHAGHADAGAIVALVFPVIVLTVIVYGLCARPVARRLGVAAVDPQGVLLIGADIVARELAMALRGLGLDVLLVDTNPRNASLARTSGLRTWHGSVLSSRFVDEAELSGIGYVLALLPSAEINRVALRQLQPAFDRARLFRLGQPGAREERDGRAPGRVLFTAEATFEWLQQQLRSGAKIRATRLTEQFGPRDYAARWPMAVPLFVWTSEHKLLVVTAEQPVVPKVGSVVVALMPAGAQEGASDSDAAPTALVDR